MLKARKKASPEVASRPAKEREYREKNKDWRILICL
jgi:hypothetical protein